MSSSSHAVVLAVCAFLALSGPAQADPAATSKRLAFFDRFIAAHPSSETYEKARVGEMEGLSGDKPCYLKVVREALCPAGWDCGFVSMAKGDMYYKMMSLMDPDGNDV